MLTNLTAIISQCVCILSIILYAWNLHNVIFQIYLNKLERKRKQKIDENEQALHKIEIWITNKHNTCSNSPIITDMHIKIEIGYTFPSVDYTFQVCYVTEARTQDGCKSHGGWYDTKCTPYLKAIWQNLTKF